MELNKAAIDRCNILNNEYAVADIKGHLDIQGTVFEGDIWLTVEQTAAYFGVDTRTVKRYIKEYGEELKSNGYCVLVGEKLGKFIEATTFVRDINVPHKQQSKARSLGVFNLKAFLNLAMLLSESQKARELRQLMLNIATNSIRQRTGGNIKYVNQRDNRFAIAWNGSKKYNSRLRRAIKRHTIDGERTINPNVYNDITYRNVFREKNHEYRNLLELSQYDKTRRTMYAEVLTTIASYENAVAATIEQTARQQNRKMNRDEVLQIFEQTAQNPALTPQIENARVTMASFDNALRNKQHEQLEEYIYPINKSGYERFLSDKNKEFNKIIDNNEDVYQRLKDQ